MGVKIDKVMPVSNKELQVLLKHLGNDSSTVDKNIVIVGGVENLAGSSTVPLGWRNSTTVPLVFEGIGSIYSTQSISMDVFPLTQ